MNMVGQTLGNVATKCAVGSRSSKELWENLRQKFAAPNKQNILQLKSNLQNLKKGGDDIETYLDKIKVARDALETVGVQVDDKDIVVIVLRGLPSEFAAIKTVIRAQFVSCSLTELKTLLKAAELDIESENQFPPPLTAMVANNNSQNNAGSPTANALVVNPASTSTIHSSMPIQPTVQAPLVPHRFNPINSPLQNQQVPTVMQATPLQAVVEATPLQAMMQATPIQALMQATPMQATSFPNPQPYYSMPVNPYSFNSMTTNNLL
ncbi:hypothetical protein ACLB2K_037388 [Fragaria x ananassa]